MSGDEVRRIIAEGLAVGAADQVVRGEMQRMLVETASEYFLRTRGIGWEVVAEPYDEIAYGLPLGCAADIGAVLLPLPFMLTHCWHAPALRGVSVVAGSNEEAAEMANAWSTGEPVDPCPAPHLHPERCGPGPFISVEDPAWQEAHEWVNGGDLEDEPPF